MSDKKALAAQAAIDQARALMRANPKLAENRLFVLGLKMMQHVLDEYLEAHDLPSMSPGVMAGATMTMEGAFVRTGTGVALRSAGWRAVTTPNPYVIAAGLLLLVLSIPGGMSVDQMIKTFRLDQATRALNKVVAALAAEQVTERTMDVARDVLSTYERKAVQQALLAGAVMAVAIAEVDAVADKLAELGRKLAGGGELLAGATAAVALRQLVDVMDKLLRRLPPGDKCKELLKTYRFKVGNVTNSLNRGGTSDPAKTWRALLDAAKALVDCLTANSGGGGSAGAAPA